MQFFANLVVFKKNILSNVQRRSSSSQSPSLDLASTVSSTVYKFRYMHVSLMRSPLLGDDLRFNFEPRHTERGKSMYFCTAKRRVFLLKITSLAEHKIIQEVRYTLNGLCVCCLSITHTSLSQFFISIFYFNYLLRLV